MASSDQEVVSDAVDKLPGLKRFYKYYRFNKLDEENRERIRGILNENKLYFPSPTEFNDPFDSKVRYVYEGTKNQRKQFLLQKYRLIYPQARDVELRHLVKTIIKDGKDEEVMLTTAEEISDNRKKMGIFSMTQKKDDILMWAHYAYNHTGFCLEFDATSIFFRTAFPIKYEPNLPILNIIISYHPVDEAEKLLTKANDWEYEAEWRLIDYEDGPGFKYFPPEALTGVIFGCKMIEEDMHEIIQWCMKRNPRPKLFRAKEKEKEFGLDVFEIDY